MITFRKTYYLSFIIVISQLLLINSSLTNIEINFQSQINIISGGSLSDTTLNQLSSKGGIYEISTITGSINSYDYAYQISFLNNQYIESSGVKFPQILISNECKKTIISFYTGSTDILVTKIFKPVNLLLDTTTYKITDVIFYQFFPFKNNQMDSNEPIDITSKCNEDVTIYSPLEFDDDNKLKNKFLAVAGQNPDSGNLRDYDIFDPNSQIYKDICYPITFSYASENIITKDSFKNYDITLEQRKKYYFPGDVVLCPSEECSYLGTDKETFSAICKCEFNKDFDYNTIQVVEHTNFNGFSYNAKKFRNSNKDNYFSMETFKCIKLPFTKAGFKGNYGSIIMICIICVAVLSYIILAISGKHHLLSVLELLYNSNIKSMNYIKNFQGNNFQIPNQNPIPYDVRSNNFLLSSQKGIQPNALLMSSSNFGNTSTTKPAPPLQINKRNNTKKNSGIQIVKNNILNKNKINSDKSTNNLIYDEIKENDVESERNSIAKEKTDILSNNKTNIKNENPNNQQFKNDTPKREEPKKEEPRIEEPKIEEPRREEPKREEPRKEEPPKEETEEESEEDEISQEEQNNNMENKNDDKKKEDEEEDEDEDEEDEEEDDDNGNKANPPKKKGKKRNPKLLDKDDSNGKVVGKENGKENGGDESQKATKIKNKKKKEKTPIEIALNVKELKDMMFKNMPKQQNDNNNDNTPPPQNNPPPPQNNQNMSNGLNFPQFMNPLSFFPPPYANYNNNEDAIRKEYENRARQKELEYQRERELAEMREKERRRELEDMRERERQRQRDLDYERERRQRDELYKNLDNYKDRDRGRDDDRYYENKRNEEELNREKERIYQQNQEIQRMREQLQKEYDQKQNEAREKDLEMQKELTKVKDQQKDKELEFEKKLLKQKQDLTEQFEKEKKEIIEQKDKELQILKEEKEREIKRLKEDKDREVNYMKQDIDREKKNQEELIKKKEKEIKKEKKKLQDMQKTSNSFPMNQTMMQQQMIDMSNMMANNEKNEKPQIVVPIDSILTDQELNAMDFNDSCMYDKRTLYQTYLSYINRKQPLFFLFNYNTSSSHSASIFQINYQSIKFLVFCLEIMIYLFFYATFFGSKSISYIFFNKFNSRRKCIIAIILSPFCMIVKSVCHYFIYDDINKKISEIKIRCYTNFKVGRKREEIKENQFKDFWESEEEQKNEKDKDDKNKEEMADIQEIEDDNLPEEEKQRRKDKYEKRKLKTLINELIYSFKRKIIISVVVMIFVLFIMWYYISAFCAVYKNSQLLFFENILISYAFSNLIPFVYCLIPTLFRQEGVKEESQFSFTVSKIFQII